VCERSALEGRTACRAVEGGKPTCARDKVSHHSPVRRDDDGRATARQYKTEGAATRSGWGRGGQQFDAMT
jgi:hypothetical protein